MLIHRLLDSTRHRLLCTTMCCLLVTAPDAMAAFDPDAGKDETAAISTQHLTRSRTAPAPMMMVNRHATPANRAGFIPTVDKVATPKPLYPTRAAAPVEAVAATSSPTIAPLPSSASMEQEMEVAATSIAPLPSLPPVSGEVKAKANQVMDSHPQAENAPQETQMAGYIAPPPPLPDMAPLATNVVTPAAPSPVSATNESAPVDIIDPDMRSSTGKSMNSAVNIAPPPPVIGANIPAPAPLRGQSANLSNETKEILGRIPNHVGEAPPAAAPTRTTLSRVSPEVSSLIPNLEKQMEYEQAGLKISMSRQGFDSNIELGRAYEALIAGDSEMAVDIYQNIIAAEPRNQDALFGLAATYHRAGELAKARPLYGALLRINPNHREGLNNFLVLVSDEAPEEALFELQKLAERNPQFSPIRAQMAVLLEKLGQHDLAREEMIKAIRMAPENLVYKYNLAIMMDKQGRYADASALYGLLVDAALRGESIPAPLEDIQKRLTYINTASIDTRGS
ncbi:MAG: tetratricopeptide repeat protein [Rickettsiales bacterium]